MSAIPMSTRASPDESVDEATLIRKLFLRLVPLLILLYVVSYIDRVNVGFAALTMNRDIGLSATAYGLGAGVFFIGYCLFEVPSNLLMVRVGARRWIARIVCSWSIVAALTTLAQGPKSFLALRFLLGVAEAGFFPAVVVYLTTIFPARYRGRILAAFSFSIPLALAIGAPVSTTIMELDGLLGLHGWQWLYLLEALPGIPLMFWTLRALPDVPGEARWLTPDERRWLDNALRRDAVEARQGMTFWRVLRHPGVLTLCVIYMCATSANIGLSLFLPQIIKRLGFTTLQTGFITSVPYLFGCAGLLVFGHLSDRHDARRRTLAVALAIAACGLGLAGWYAASSLSIAALSLATIGILGCKGPFWALPARQLGGRDAAVGIALINCIGNLGGFFGPSILGVAQQWTHSFDTGLYVLAGLAALAAGLTYALATD